MRSSEDIQVEIRRILDTALQKKLRAFFAQNSDPTVDQWKLFCGTLGIKKVMVTKTQLDRVEEYALMPKSSGEKRGHYKKAANHRGYFIVTRATPTKRALEKRTAYVEPVFAFQTRQEVEARLKKEEGLKIVDFFWSNCQVYFDKPWLFKGTEYPPGEYTLKTLWEEGRAVLKHASLGSIGERPKHSAPVGLAILVQAGIRCASRGRNRLSNESKSKGEIPQNANLSVDISANVASFSKPLSEPPSIQS